LVFPDEVLVFTEGEMIATRGNVKSGQRYLGIYIFSIFSVLFSLLPSPESWVLNPESTIIHNPRIWVGDSKQNEGRTNGQKQIGGSNSENPFWCQIREHMIGG